MASHPRRGPNRLVMAFACVATVALAAIAAKAGKVHVIGTTGFSAADDVKIAEAAKTATIVKSGNMSLGVNLLAALTKRVAKTLDASFDIEVLEMHHNQKIDAPSGIAPTPLPLSRNLRPFSTEVTRACACSSSAVTTSFIARRGSSGAGDITSSMRS